LTDHDTPLWLAEEYRTDEVSSFIGFHTGAPIVSALTAAQFAFASRASLPPLAQFNLGTQEYPDRSTTVVLALPALEGGPDLVLRGPGIEDHWHISPMGLPDDFSAQWASNRTLFPRGIDLLLVADGKVMGLPRTVRIEEHH
jgi:alpha-D-ribose 1-methylphosphonate 5-triphosphate synthase subunit PhnH